MGRPTGIPMSDEAKAKISAARLGNKCPTGCECARHTRQGDPTSLKAMHKRVRIRRGNASEHLCVDCEKQARDWSRIHGKEGWDIMDYEPRCRKCHCFYDRIANGGRTYP